MPLAPQKTYPAPNAVYAPSINLGMSLVAGQPVGIIRNLSLKPAYVDAAGVWHDAGLAVNFPTIQFGFDANGVPTGLPADLQALAPQIAAAWAAIVTVIDAVNKVRKSV